MTYANALRPSWTPLTIILMLIGFAVAWPLGFLMLAYILFGSRIPQVREHFEGMRRDWCGPSGWRDRGHDASSASPSGNAAFDDYRAAELRRLDEERRRLEEERRQFEAYARDLRRARDKEEFDRFMANRSRRTGNRGDTIDL
ncbi:MAG: DUF2852 domain-containing protein [Bauldia sp.]